MIQGFLITAEEARRTTYAARLFALEGITEQEAYLMPTALLAAA